MPGFPDDGAGEVIVDESGVVAVVRMVDEVRIEGEVYAESELRDGAGEEEVFVTKVPVPEDVR